MMMKMLKMLSTSNCWEKSRSLHQQKQVVAVAPDSSKRDSVASSFVGLLMKSKSKKPQSLLLLHRERSS